MLFTVVGEKQHDLILVDTQAFTKSEQPAIGFRGQQHRQKLKHDYHGGNDLNHAHEEHKDQHVQATFPHASVFIGFWIWFIHTGHFSI